MRSAPKVMPPISSCWPMISEVDVGNMAVGAEPFHQYPITCCCCGTDDSRAADWQNGTEMEVHLKQRHAFEQKWHPLPFINAHWMFMETQEWMWAQWGSRWCVSAVAIVGRLCRYIFWWGTQALVCCWWKCIGQQWWVCWKVVFVAENVFY